MSAALPRHHARVAPPLRLLCVLLALTGASRLLGDSRVAVRATADSEYVRQRTGNGEIKDQTYVFAEGRFFAGHVRDNTLEKTPFARVAKTLSSGLVAQHYFPSVELDDAELILIVHWGVTAVADNGYKMLAQTSPQSPNNDALQRGVLGYLAAGDSLRGISPASDLNLLASRTHFSEERELNRDAIFSEVERVSSDISMASNARLLGFGETLQADRRSLFGTTEGQIARSMLSEERYFVIVLAYDCQVLFREHRLKRLWSTRLSLPSPGMNFSNGVVNMASVGAAFFGQDVEGIQIKRSKEPLKDADLGPVTVIKAAMFQK